MQSKRVPLFIVCLFVVPAAFGQMSAELQKKVGDAIRQHRTDLAAEYICEAAKQDAKLQGTCLSNQQQVEVQLQKFEQKYNDGTKAVQEGRFEDAKTAFRTIYFGDYKDRAQEMLNKLPALQQQAQSNQQAADSAKKQETDDAQHMAEGLTAFENGDFAGAKAQLNKVLGNRRSEAQITLNKINQYEQAMSEGQQAESQKNYDLAKAKYGVAASIKPNGPGGPGGRVQTMDTLVRQAQQAGNRQQSAPSRQIESKPQPKVDIARLLRDAQRSKATGDTREARKLYLQVLQADAGNTEALSAMDELSRKAGSSEVDAMLADGIRAFYNGSYADSEESLKFYLLSKGSKVGVAKFYRGAVKLTRFYLDPKPDNSLYDDALQEFKAAKRVTGFAPPDARYISPKILKVYEQASL